ncbi:MAG: hypothetical protein OEN50_15880, partial [Deltaproteobacteria bacterium]|nr:hypothetical protein [Deltaproteobacteria bacterium]
KLMVFLTADKRVILPILFSPGLIPEGNPAGKICTSVYGLNANHRAVSGNEKREIVRKWGLNDNDVF